VTRAARIAVPAGIVAVAAVMSFVAGPAEAPAFAPSAAQLLRPRAHVEEVRLVGGALVRAPGVEIVPGGVRVSRDDRRRVLAGVVADGPVRARTSWLGTDMQGRDLAERLVAGARTSLIVAAVAAFVAVVLGALVGVAGVTAGRRLGAGVRVAVDAALAVPRMLLVLLLGAALAGSPAGIGLAIGLVSWMGLSRVVDAECRALAGQGFIEASRAIGSGWWRIAIRHLAPHLAPILVTALPVAATEAVLLEATLSFFGIGAGVGADSWGAMIADGRRLVPGGWWLAVFPGLLVCAGALTFHALARALRGGAEKAAIRPVS